jgi:glycosyltransferase involved in cell wall biosynthesis
LKTVILIPAYNPDGDLVSLARQLAQEYPVVVVNDGSEERCNSIFEELQHCPRVVVVHHAVNQGKGAALKTGIKTIQDAFPDVQGVVTADADGQHRVEDIFKVAKKLGTDQNSLILGVRTFRGKVPLRSMIGNTLTRTLLMLVMGVPLRDTQTGLRGIPVSLMTDLVKIPYNRYEFEMEMLLWCRQKDVPIQEIPIQTIYLNNNQSSHFNPLLDSMKIYFVLFRYTFASLFTSMIDYFVFIFSYPVIQNILYTTYLSRIVAIALNFVLVRKMVFSSKKKILQTFPKYLGLVALSGFLSSSMVYYLVQATSMRIIIAKLIAESLLYTANFLVQKYYIFNEEDIEK